MKDAPTVVTFKWQPPAGYRSTFTAEHVNVLYSMIARHYPKPFNFCCVTDDRRGLRKEVRPFPLWNDHAQLKNPFGGRRGPSCYRRLKLFARDAGEIFGKRIIALDLDMVVTGDLSPLFDRQEDFVIWGDTHPRTFYNGSFWSLRAGAHPELWEEFDPARSPAAAKEKGFFGSDQAWISYRLGPSMPTFGKADGIYSYRVEIAPNGHRLPAGARLVVFHGKIDPWSPAALRHKWVRDNWR